MKKKIKLFSKFAIFIVVLFITIMNIENMLLLKQYSDNEWPHTDTYTEFYRQDNNSIDVLFLGSSNAVSSFCPQELYDQYGITSYNLGCQQQNVLCSYYWLVEALKYQTPKAVVLETYLIHPFDTDSPLNSPESRQRFAIDSMKWSINKVNAINDICTWDSDQIKSSYYLINIRYHERWKDGLVEDDFSNDMLKAGRGLRGYTALDGHVTADEYCFPEPFNAESDTETTYPLHSVMQIYLDKIVSLCDKNNINLILCRVPTSAETIGHYNGINNYSKNNNIRFLDFNEQSLYSESGIDYYTDCNDNGGHANVWGAKKITDYIGKLLVREYGLEGHFDASFEATKDNYEVELNRCNLKYITNSEIYFRMLDESNYNIIIAYQSGTESLFFNSEALEKAINNNNIIYLNNIPDIEYFTLRDGIVPCSGYSGEVTSSIVIDGEEYSKQMKGINIVVYDNNKRRVIDSITLSFDLKTITR